MVAPGPLHQVEQVAPDVARATVAVPGYVEPPFKYQAAEPLQVEPGRGEAVVEEPKVPDPEVPDTGLDLGDHVLGGSVPHGCAPHPFAAVSAVEGAPPPGDDPGGGEAQVVAGGRARHVPVEPDPAAVRKGEVVQVRDERPRRARLDAAVPAARKARDPRRLPAVKDGPGEPGEGPLPLAPHGIVEVRVIGEGRLGQGREVVPPDDGEGAGRALLDEGGGPPCVVELAREGADAGQDRPEVGHGLPECPVGIGLHAQVEKGAGNVLAFEEAGQAEEVERNLDSGLEDPLPDELPLRRLDEKDGAGRAGTRVQILCGSTPIRSFILV